MPKNLAMLELKRRCRGAVRRVALEASAARQQGLGAAWFDPAPRVQVLLLHDVRPRDLAPFERLVAKLGETFRLVSYSEAVRLAASGGATEPTLAFSFDDGLSSCLDAAIVLQEHGASACFFVCPWLVDQPPVTELATFCHEKLWHGPKQFMDWDALEALRDEGHEIGAHTLHHSNLAECSPSELANEVAGSRQQIVSRLGECDHFAWPYGRFHHLSEAAAQEVFAAGYTSCASGERGSHAGRHETEATDQYSGCLRRESIRADWPIRHIAYFLNLSARRSTPLTAALRTASPSLRAA